MECWICGRSEEEIKKELGEDAELKESGLSYKLLVCSGCEEIIVSEVIEREDFSEIVKEIVADALKK